MRRRTAEPLLYSDRSYSNNIDIFMKMFVVVASEIVVVTIGGGGNLAK